jgi:hypothetical protein
MIGFLISDMYIRIHTSCSIHKIENSLKHLVLGFIGPRNSSGQAIGHLTCLCRQAGIRR